MKRVLTLLLALIGFSAFSQTGYQPYNFFKKSDSVNKVLTHAQGNTRFLPVAGKAVNSELLQGKDTVYLKTMTGINAATFQGKDTTYLKTMTNINSRYLQSVDTTYIFTKIGGGVGTNALTLLGRDTSEDLPNIATHYWSAFHPNFYDSLVVKMSGDSITLSADGSDAYLRWSDGNLNLKSKETNTNVIVGPVGGGGTGTVTIRDGSGAYLTTLTQNDGTLNIQALTSAHNIVINDDSEHSDFRVESDNNTDMLFVNGSGDKVGIGKDPSLATLDVNGSVLAQVVAISSVDTSSGTYPVGSMFMRINGSDTSMWIKIRNTGSLAARWKKVTLTP
jgi:hypothetical protein